MHRDRNVSVKNLADAEKGAKRQVDELLARDATIIQLTDQLDRVTAESNKKSTKIEDLRNDSSKKSSKVDDPTQSADGTAKQTGRASSTSSSGFGREGL